MKAFFNENKQLLTSFLAISIILPIIILTPSPFGFISYETGLTTVGYCGSILGGFLTLYGVWWTIKRQDDQRREDLAMQYRPILNCKIQGHSVLDDTLFVSLMLTNTGRAEAIDINIELSSNMSIRPQISSNKTHMLEMNHNFSFSITLEHIKQKINDNCYEISPIGTIFDAKNIFPQALVKITYTDIVQTSYCLEFEMLCQYVRQGSFDESENLVSHEIFEKLESTPKSWLIDLTNLQVKKLN